MTFEEELAFAEEQAEMALFVEDNKAFEYWEREIERLGKLVPIR